MLPARKNRRNPAGRTVNRDQIELRSVNCDVRFRPLLKEHITSDSVGNELALTSAGTIQLEKKLALTPALSPEEREKRRQSPSVFTVG